MKKARKIIFYGRFGIISISHETNLSLAKIF